MTPTTDGQRGDMGKPAPLTPRDPNEWLTPTQVGKEARMDPRKVRLACRRRELTHRNDGDDARPYFLIRRRDMDAWLASLLVRAR